MRDLTRHNAKRPAWLVLKEMGLEVFTPMTQILRTVAGRRIKIERPVITDLLFVKSTQEALEAIVAKMPTLQFRFVKGAPYRTPMTVRTTDMERFIAAVNSTDTPRYYLPEELTPDMIGQPVRIIEGPLAGYQGTLLKLRGSSHRRILVSLQDYLIAAVEVDRNYLQLL